MHVLECRNQNKTVDCQTQLRCIMIDSSSDGHVKQRNNCKIVMREAQNYLCMVRNPLGFIDTYLTPDRK